MKWTVFSDYNTNIWRLLGRNRWSGDDIHDNNDIFFFFFDAKLSINVIESPCWTLFYCEFWKKKKNRSLSQNMCVFYVQTSNVTENLFTTLLSSIKPINLQSLILQIRTDEQRNEFHWKKILEMSTGGKKKINFFVEFFFCDLLWLLLLLIVIW